MKKLVYCGTLFLFFMVAVNSHAEMKMTPNGITFPDSSTQIKAVSGGGVGAPLNLSGSFNTGDFAENPNGSVISGVNAYAGDYSSFGGYFSSDSPLGFGVYGYASSSEWETNFGGYFVANGVVGIGVTGKADGSFGYGIRGAAGGSSGRAVHGYASHSGDATNYGGYFEADGQKGRGVYGAAKNDGVVINYGGYFEAAGHQGRGVYSEAPGIQGKGVYGYASNTQGVGVQGYGGLWDFYAVGPGTNYGPFTGAHEVRFSEDMPEIIPGLIVSTTGKTEARKNKRGKISLSSTLPTVTLSTKANDKAVFGVIVSDGPLPKDHWYEAQEGENFGIINALGEGRVWVTNRNGDIENGDYITTSEIPGYGQMQDDDILHSYTLGKAIEAVDWERISETVEHGGETFKIYLIAIVYTSG